MALKVNDSKNRRKINIFVVFLICSSLIWLISKLSEDYNQRSSFALNFGNMPDTLLLTGASRQEIDVRVRASGFQLLSFNFGKKDLEIDLSQLRYNRRSFFLPPADYRKQIEVQIPGNMTLLEVDQDTIYIDFKKLYTREVAVVPNITLDLAQNHLLEGDLKVEPSHVVIKGPRNEIRKIAEIPTVAHTISSVSSDFSTAVELAKLEELPNTTYNEQQVQVSGEVVRFSEQVFDVPVKVINLPEGSEIKTFPNTVSVLCRARIDRLKVLRPQDFKLVADFSTAKAGEKQLNVAMESWPEGVYGAQLMEDEVEFVLIRR